MGRLCACCSRGFDKYLDVIVAAPCCIVSLWIVVPIAAIVIGLLAGGGLPTLETDLASGGYLRSDGIISDRRDALKAAEDYESQRVTQAGMGRRLADQRFRDWNASNAFEEADEYHEVNDMIPEMEYDDRRLNAKEPERMFAEWKVDIYYEAKNGNIFDPATISEIRSLELKINALSNFRKLCLAVSALDNSCREHITAMRFFYGSERKPGVGEAPAQAENPYVSSYVYPNGGAKLRNNIGAVLTTMAEPRSWRQIEGQFGRLWYFDSQFPNSKLMRTRLWFGLPLPGYDSRSHNRGEQKDKYSDFVADELYPLLKDASTDRMKVFFEGPVITAHETKVAVLKDALLAGLSLVLVYLYMCFYMRAPGLACMGMITVVLSVPFGTLLFCMLGHKTFPVINLLALFLLTGIGADHLFVLTDSWRQAKFECGTGDLKIKPRLKYMFGRAGKAVTACGVTTAVSFLANLFSAVRPVRWFGVFVGLCVLSNLVLCLGIYPIVLVIREKTKPQTKAICRKLHLPGGGNPAAVATGVNEERPPVQRSDANYTKSEKFLQKYANCLTKVRFLVVALCLIFTFGGLALLTQSLKVSRAPPEFFDEGDHNLVDAPLRRGEFGNASRWAPDMEWEPLLLCGGCQWPQTPAAGTGYAASGCERIGWRCQALPCQGSAVVDPYPCAGRGTCSADGRCDCKADYTGADCRQIAGASSSDCGAGLGQVECSGHGICNRGFCWCSTGWVGEQCSNRVAGYKDCKWGGYTDWSVCSKTCGSGQQTRTRIIAQQQGPNGEPCKGTFIDTRACKIKECDVDCKWGQWTAYGDCNSLCGAGLKKRTRAVAVEAQYQGKSCVGDKEQFETCTKAACGPACTISQWKADGVCSKTCGGGQLTEKRTVQAAAHAKPGECPTDTVRFVACNPSACPATCTYSAWQDTGDCSVNCGTGRQAQTRTVTAGTDCTGELARTVACVKTCPTEPPVCNDASFSSWSSWGPCSAACGPSERHRTRQAKPGFEACNNSPEKVKGTEACATEKCPPGCDTYPWKDDGSCSVSCGIGNIQQKRDFGSDTPPSKCSKTRITSCAGGRECPRHCILGAWIQSKECSVKCGAGLKEEIRPVVQNGAFGGEACPASVDRTRVVACNGNDCSGPPPPPPPVTLAPAFPPAPTPPAPATPAPSGPVPAPTPAPNTKIQFKLTLYGKSSATGQQRDAIKAAVASLLGLQASEVASRRLGQSLRRLADTEITYVVPLSAVGNLGKLETAISTGTLYNTLRAGPGFDDLTHMGYTRSSTTIVQQKPSTPVVLPTPFAPSPGPPSPPPAATTPARKRVLPDSECAQLSIVMGLEEDPPETTADIKVPVFDNKFDFGRASAQMALEKICKLAVERKAELGVRKNLCFVNDFRVFMSTKGTPGYPVAADRVHRSLLEFISSFYGKGYRGQVGFSKDGRKVLWVSGKIITDLPAKMPASDAWDWSRKWDKFVDEQNELYRGKGVGKMFHTSDLWVRAETETRLIESTLICACFSVVFALVAVLFFLWNLALAVYLILGILCVIICLAATMFGVLGWTFGAVEAVGLIVFVGFSVDYSLHMAESFNQSTEKTRQARVKDALTRTGGAIVAAAITSAFAGVPILLCTMKVFVKFGTTIVLNTVLSLIFSVGFLCALLLIIGPENNFGSCDVFWDMLLGRHRRQRDEPTVTGTVVGTVAGQNPNDYKWTGGAPTDGYKWDTGEEDPNDPKKPQKGSPPKEEVPGAPPQMQASSEDNPALEDTSHLQEPVRVRTPTRGDEPTVVGRGGESTM